MSTEAPQTASPATKVDHKAETVAKRRRIPMSVPQRKLEIPEIPGYHLHWFLDANVPRAIQAGYEFVDIKDVETSQFGIANSVVSEGTASLGSHVQVVASRSGEGGMLTLMKLPEEYFKEDQQLIENRNRQVLDSIFNRQHILGQEGMSDVDKAQTYVKKDLTKVGSEIRRASLNRPPPKVV